MNRNIFLIGLIVGIILSGCIQREKSTLYSVDTIKDLNNYLDKDGVLRQPQPVILQGVISTRSSEFTDEDALCGKYFLKDATDSIRLALTDYKGAIDDYLDRNVEVSGDFSYVACENICGCRYIIIKTINFIQ